MLFQPQDHALWQCVWGCSQIGLLQISGSSYFPSNNAGDGHQPGPVHCTALHCTALYRRQRRHTENLCTATVVAIGMAPPTTCSCHCHNSSKGPLLMRSDPFFDVCLLMRSDSFFDVCQTHACMCSCGCLFFGWTAGCVLRLEGQYCITPRFCSCWAVLQSAVCTCGVCMCTGQCRNLLQVLLLCSLLGMWRLIPCIRFAR